MVPIVYVTVIDDGTNHGFRVQTWLHECWADIKIHCTEVRNHPIVSLRVYCLAVPCFQASTMGPRGDHQPLYIIAISRSHQDLAASVRQ